MFMFDYTIFINFKIEKIVYIKNIYEEQSQMDKCNYCIKFVLF